MTTVSHEAVGPALGYCYQAIYALVKSGFLFEYRATKKLVLSLSGGAMTTITSRIFEQGKKPKNYLVNNNQGTVPYAQVGISLLPLWRPFKKK